MTHLPLPTTQLTPLARDRGTGITRLARRTQRGQGGRRLLVLVLAALSVGVGVAAAILAATVERSDTEVQLDDRFGPASAVYVDVGDGVFGFAPPVPSEAQQAWLDAHPYTGPARPVDQPMDPVPATAEVEVALAELGATHDDAAFLAFGTSGAHQYWSADDDVLVTDIDTTHPLAGGSFVVDGGPRALSGDEALLSPALLADLDAGVGDTVTLSGVGEVEVVGTVTRAARRSQPLAVLAPGRAPAAGWSELAVRLADESTTEAFVAAVQRAEEATPGADGPGPAAGDGRGVNLERRSDHLLHRADPTTVATLVGGVVTSLATTLAALVAACAFAVGVRRRIREIGMLGAIGASPSQVRRLLRREGVLIGTGGAVLGAAVGSILVIGGLPVIERLLDRELLLVVPVTAVLLPVLLGGLGALLASVWPARTAARVPTVTALAGRVPLGRVPAGLPVLGAAAAVVGLLLLSDLLGPTATDDDALAALQLLAATLLSTLGVAALGLPVVALGGRIADRLPLLGRLALRDAARQRTRSGAAVAALVPVLAIPVAALTMVVSDPFGEMVDPETGITYDEPAPSTVATVRSWPVDGRWPPPDETTVDRVAGMLPGAAHVADVVQLGRPDLLDPAVATVPGTNPMNRQHLDQLTLATPELMAALGLPADAVTPAAVTVLSAAGWVTPPADLDEVVLVAHVYRPAGAGTEEWTEQALATVPVTVRPEGESGAPSVLVHPDLADRLDLVETGRSALLRLDRPPTPAEAAAVHASSEESGGVGAGTYVDLSPSVGFWRSPTGVALLTLLGALVTLLAVAAVAGMTSALAATESDADLRKAVALGAAPSLRRRFHGLQAWWHTAIATVLGTGLGLAVAAAAVDATRSYATGGELVRATVDPPWLAIGAWVVVLPVLVGLLIAAVMRSAPVTAPRRRTA